MALALVLLAAGTLVGLAQRSTAEALGALGEIESVQRRWAVRSLSEAVVGRAEAVLDARAAAAPAAADAVPSDGSASLAPARVAVTLQLASLDYELVFTDEQAKINVNRLIERDGLFEAQTGVRRLSGAGPGSDAVTLRTLAITDASVGPGAALPEIGAYGQVFGDAPPRRLLGGAGEPGLADRVTCWGDGRVNIRRAPDAVVREACDRELRRELVEAILEARRAAPGQPLDTLLGTLGNLDDAERTEVTRLLTDESSAYGLWIVARGEQRAWYTLTVGVGSGGGASGDASGGGGAAAGVSQRHEFGW